MTNRIKKVQIIRIKAYGGKLSDKQEVLAELPSIKMAEAAIRMWQEIGHNIQCAMRKEIEDVPNSHCGRYVWKQNDVDPESFGYDRYWRPDFWHSSDEILVERIYTKVIR